MATLTARLEAPPWLAHVPTPLFTVVMGLGGLGLAWREAEVALGLPGLVGELILVVAGACFVVIAGLYGGKVLRHRRAVLVEFNHPVRSCYFGAASLGLMVLAVGALPHSTTLAQALWLPGAALQLVIGVVVLGRWFHRAVMISDANPAWFIPVASSVVAPLAGAPLGYVETSWFFLATGLVFWLALFTLMLNRIIFHDQLPAKSVPTLFIMIAPPAVAFSSYLSLNGYQLDPFARFLLAPSLFLTLLLASMARQFLRLPFALSWWAFTFPTCALTLAVLHYYELRPDPLLAALAVALLAATTVICGAVAARTVRALRAGTVFVPD